MTLSNLLSALPQHGHVPAFLRDYNPFEPGVARQELGCGYIGTLVSVTECPDQLSISNGV